MDESGYIDTHCHLYDTRGAAQADVIAQARAAGVTTMITVGCDAATTASAIETAREYDGIHATAGLHPHEASHGVETILGYLDDPQVIAIGECGLDYYYDHSPRELQRIAFAAQIQSSSFQIFPERSVRAASVPPCGSHPPHCHSAPSDHMWL